nr:YheC/YheD family protein [Bacillus suaedaesalsae]
MLIKEGTKIVNNCRMTKNKLWELLYKTKVRHYLPYTRRLRNIDSLIETFKTYDSVYLKPTNLSRGNGIFKIVKTDVGFEVQTKRKEIMNVSSKSELGQILKKLTKRRKYLIQQDVSYKEVEKRMVDFRVYLQKDSTRNWNCSGIICRVSMPGCVVSNLKYTEKVLSYHDASRFIFGFTINEEKTIEHEIIEACRAVCRELKSKKQIIGDVALDVAVDSNLKVWILEVQINYAVDERLYNIPEAIYRKVWTTPIEYAKALSEFNN